MRKVLAFVFALGCTTPPIDDGECPAEVLFGRPSEATGLSGEQCQPRCSDCGEVVWEAPEIASEEVEAWLEWELVDPPARLDEDPYSTLSPTEIPPDAVCGMLPESDGSRRYRLVNYASAAAAEAAGAFVTHTGTCGLCSSLEDLVVYATNNDLTAPVRDCGIEHFFGTKDEHVACLETLGFTGACADIWYYNTVHTREVCQTECISGFDDPYNNPDGSLNECLQCDEVHSGPVFKAVAGRTRRNTGLPNAMCRPCSEVHPLEHNYPN